MTTAKKTSRKDQLLAQVELLQHRLDWYRESLEEHVGQSRSSFDARADEIRQRMQWVDARHGADRLADGPSSEASA